MTGAYLAATKPVVLTVRKDFRAIRSLLRRVKHSTPFAGLGPLGCGDHSKASDYVDRRDCVRRPVQVPIQVKPVIYDGQQVERISKPGIFAITRDLSKVGVGFMHDVPLDAKFAIATADLLDGHRVAILLEVRWSNIRSGLSYLSGAIFSGIVESVEPSAASPMATLAGHESLRP